jgi:hypothetical protein
MIWHALHPKAPEFTGLIPSFLNEEDERSAAQQFGEMYKFGGWRPFEGFTLGEDNSLTYPGDPPLKPMAWAKLRDEVIIVYRHAWVAVIQPDRSFEVARMD